MATTNLIAVGTAGLVLVFDSSQVMKWFLGGGELGASHGAVSSLAFNSDLSCLLAGLARGQLVEFDINLFTHPAFVHTKVSTQGKRSIRGPLQNVHCSTLYFANPIMPIA